MKTSHFNFLSVDRPSLCGYCFNPVGGLLTKFEDKWYGACCVEHQREIVKGNKLKNIAQVSKKGVAYAKAQSRDRYIEISKENKSWALRDWTEEDRMNFFDKIIREYLNYANDQARNGVDGSQEI